MVSSKGIRIEDKKIEAVKQWLEPQSVQDIQIFLGFANFYWRFIQRFSRIAALFTSILKILGSTEFLTRPGKGGVRVGIDIRAGHDRSELNKNEIDGDEIRNDEFGKKVQKLSKSKNLSKSKKTVGSDFLTPRAKLAFI